MKRVNNGRRKMKVSLMAGVVAVISGITLAFAGAPRESSQSHVRERAMVKKVDINLDEESTKQIAEIILVRVYGKRVL